MREIRDLSARLSRAWTLYRTSTRQCTLLVMTAMNASKQMTGKVALVLGGSSGIGRATAQRFIVEGADHVYITARRQAELDETAKVLECNVTAVQGDVTRAADLERIVHRIAADDRRVDAVVCSAGGGGFSPLGTITRDSFHETFTLNTAAVVFAVQAALPLLNDGASIVLVGSVAGSKGLPGATVYAGAKAALRAFARVWTHELKARRIRVNVLSPGPVSTPPVLGAPAEFRHMIVKDVPMARMASPDEIANVALFLASDASSFVTGIELFADGGWAQV